LPRSELVHSLLKGLAILEAVAHSQEGLSLQELGSTLRLKAPTAHNLARTLVSKGFLVRTPGQPKYAIGPAAVALAGAEKRKSFLGVAETVVQGLFGELSGATVVVAVPDAGDIVAVVRMAPERPGLVEKPEHRVMHAYGTASALVFQAFWPEEERAAYRTAHPFWEFGAHLWQTEERLDTFLTEVRRKGCAVPGLKSTGVFAAAAPGFGRGGELVAAIGASIPGADIPGEKETLLVESVIRAAERFTGMLK